MSNSSATHAVPYWRLSAFYFAYFSAVGALIPYLGPYLRSIGFGAEAIGALLALPMATRIVAPVIWAWFADRGTERLRVVRLAAFLAGVAFTGMLFGTGRWWLAGVLIAFSFAWNAALPQFEAVTLNHLGPEVRRYTRIRLWGSIGFIVSVVVLGKVLDTRPPAVLPYFVLALLAGTWLVSLAVPPAGRRPAARGQEPILRVLRRPRVLAFLLACLLMQASHGAYYAFFSIYLADHGYANGTIGALWALGVASEVALFLVMHSLLARYTLRALFLSCFALTALRWILVAEFPQRMTLLVLAQVLHAASFGVYHAVAIQLVHRFFVGRQQGRGQALYSSASFGVGGALGSVASGYAWTAAGAGATWLGAALAAALGLAVVWVWVRGPEQAE